MIRPSIPVRGDLATLFGVGAVGRRSDAELLTQFQEGRGDAASEAAFAVIVARHGPMVQGVCRRVLGDAHAAEDAFQATFLVLARKAPSVRVEDSLGRWLYGVSVRVARRAKTVAVAERGRVQALHGFDPPDESGASDPCWRDDLRTVIDEEIARLPARYRSAVVLCCLEGLTQEQASRRLRCPVGTIQSRLHRARERLRSRLARRGIAPAAGGLAALAATTSRAAVPLRLAAATTAAAARFVAGGALAGAVPATVAALVRPTLKGMLMIKRWWIGSMLMSLGLFATGVGVLASKGDGGAKAPARPPDTPKPGVGAARSEPSIAERLAQILAEYKAQQVTFRQAMEKAGSRREQGEIRREMAPDEVAYTRRMVDLAESVPADQAARDALIWVINFPNMHDEGPYGDEFARAAALLVRHHGDDPEAVRIGLRLDNVLTHHRDAMLLGFYAAAKGREAKGLAGLALAQYLERKEQFAAGARKSRGRQKNIYQGVVDEDGKIDDMEVEQSDEQYAYALHLRLCDPDAIRAEAERLFEEVIAEYGDVPYITQGRRELEALLREPSPTRNGRPLTEDDRRRIEATLARKKTLAEVAEARLDEMHNLAVGRMAPEIEGVDFNGKPLKLSDYRGKIVALVFWGSWCGPCMREIPRERELVERLKDKPFALLGVDCDEDKRAALKAMEAERITWPNWHDGAPGEGPIASRYHIRGYPTVFVLDAEGVIRYKKVLGEGLDKAVDTLLKELEAKNPRK